MAFTVQPKVTTPAVLIKAGTYRANLSNMKAFANVYGERIAFEFTIHGGQFDSQQVMCSTAPQLTKHSKLAEVIEGILGRELNTQELQGGFDLEELLGQECNILVLHSKNKSGTVYSNVERVFSA